MDIWNQLEKISEKNMQTKIRNEIFHLENYSNLSLFINHQGIDVKKRIEFLKPFAPLTPISSQDTQTLVSLRESSPDTQILVPLKELSETSLPAEECKTLVQSQVPVQTESEALVSPESSEETSKSNTITKPIQKSPTQAQDDNVKPIMMPKYEPKKNQSKEQYIFLKNKDELNKELDKYTFRKQWNKLLSVHKKVKIVEFLSKYEDHDFYDNMIEKINKLIDENRFNTKKCVVYDPNTERILSIPVLIVDIEKRNFTLKN